jgi:D-3-phosphoglycerate dehydrogenase
MRILVVEDHYIPATACLDALPTALAGQPADVRTVRWSGTKAEQHHLQQQMEWHGANAVPTPPELAEAITDAQVLALHFAPVSADLLAAAPDLTAVVVARAGVENVDVDAATERGVAVVNVAGRNASGVAELSLGLMLAEGRDIARADRSVKDGQWRTSFPAAPIEVGGSCVGLVGFGHVGRQLARRLAGFDVRLLVADPYVDAAEVGCIGGTVVGLDELFEQADFVSVQARLTPETRGFIGAAQFARMKPTAYFVNVARSRLVDTAALCDALAAGRIAGAGLDVFDDEPLPADSPLRRLDNLTTTTHFGGETPNTVTRSGQLVAAAIGELARTGRCVGAVNAQALGWA